MHPEMIMLLARQRSAELVEAGTLASGRGVGGSRAATSLRAVVGRGLVRLGTRLAPPSARPELVPAVGRAGARALSVYP
jgi:hypothetical protein